MNKKYSFKNLVFQGGGIKAFAYHGVLLVLEEHNILSQIERVAGTSAGAMLATLLSFRLNVQEILELYRSVDFSKFLTLNRNGDAPKNKAIKFLEPQLIRAQSSIGGLKQLFQRYSWYDNENLQQVNQEIISEYCQGNGRATFSDFQKRGFRDLHIVATNISSHSIEIFSAATTPNVAVADALLMSQSLPLYFEPVRFDGEKIGVGDLYADGGILMNYPLHIFDFPRFTDSKGRMTHPINWETLGCRLYTPRDTSSPKKSSANLISYLEDLLETIIEAQNIAYENNFVDHFRTININDCGVLTAELKISPHPEDDRYMELVNAGKSAALDFLANYRLPTDRFDGIKKLFANLHHQWLGHHSRITTSADHRSPEPFDAS